MAGRKKWKLAVLFPYCVLIALAFGISASIARGQSRLHNHRPVHRLKPASPPPGYVPPTVASLRLQATDSNVEYWVKATENEYAIHSCPTQLTFATGPVDRRKEIFQYTSCEWLLYMFPPETNDSVLLTVWESGSAVWVRAFRIKGDTVALVFQRAAGVQPEFPWGAILLSVGRVLQPNGAYSPKSTEIWTWTGEKYRLAATVPFSQRYNALQKLPLAAWK